MLSKMIAAVTLAALPITAVTHQPAVGEEATGSFSIVGGQVQPSSAFPELVLVDITKDGQFDAGVCSGTIIDDKWVLTAAHCFTPGENETATVYAHTVYGLATDNRTHRIGYPVKRIISHPRYRWGFIQHHYDVALLELEKPISEGHPKDSASGRNLERHPNAQLRVPVATLDAPGMPIPTSGQATVAGRGTIGYAFVNEGGRRVGYPTGNAQRRAYSAEVPIRSGCKRWLMICAEDPIDIGTVQHLRPEEKHDWKQHRNPASCQGDSGGPLYRTLSSGEHRQVGIVSHSLASDDVVDFWEGDICGRVSTYYTSVSYLRPWIDAVMAANLGPTDPIPNPRLPFPPADTPPSPPGSGGDTQPTPPSANPPSATPPSTDPPAAQPPSVQPPTGSQPQPPVAPVPPAVPAPPAVPGPPVPAPPPASGPQPPAAQPPAGQPPTAQPPVQPPASDQPKPSPTPREPGVLGSLPDVGRGPLSWPVTAQPAAAGSDLAIGVNRLAKQIASTQQLPAPASQVALLASEVTMADALASGVLQDRAPLYLTNPAALEPLVAKELTTNGIREVWILGGPAAVHPSVQAELEARGIRTTRIAGQDRTQTAAAIAAAAQALQPASTPSVFIARAFGDGRDETRSWADSIALGGLAARTGTPVLLSASDQVSPALANALTRGTNTTIVGGHHAISAGVATQVTERTGLAPTRLAGQNRADTAAMIARQFKDPKQVIVIDGQGKHAWQLGFSLAGLAQRLNAPILLASGTTLPPETKAALTDLGVDQAICIGPDALCTQVHTLTKR